MDKQQQAISKHFDKEELRDMSIEDLIDLIGNAPKGTKFQGTGVVRRADGSVKYDNPELKGQYNELD